MQRQTVDFGIDLGTTNSAIARATPRGVRIVKNRYQSDTTPSAVARTAAGQALVGEDALAKPNLLPATRFKRLMGTPNRLPLYDGTDALPEELSAEIFKELKAAVQLRYDMQPEHVVVTVPAMFQQPQCEATHRAAELAGLQAVTLLQEPIAAATAYLNDEPEEGDYLVYDLGGGTYDVSIVRLRDGQMSVIAHGGDNYLGGSDFDRNLYGWAMEELQDRYGSHPHLSGDAARYILTSACEAARQRLSLQEETDIDLGDLDLPVARLTVTRGDLERLIEEPVERTLRLARERLAQANLSPGEIARVLLVGGPTFTPFIRRRLKESLGIPLSFEQDPMTVVAHGAAIYASTLLKPDRATVHVPAGGRTATLELHYEPVSPDTTTSIAGRVIEPEGFAGEVRLTRTGGGWQTGWVPLRKGAFVCEALLDSGATTDFAIALRDAAGTLWEASPASVTLRNGIAVATPVTPYRYGVVLDDGAFSPVIEYNQPLPAYGTTAYRSAKTIPVGSSEEMVVYFVEGMTGIANDNVKVGEMRIRGIDLPRTLREGEKVEVRIHMDESRRIKARVSIPLLDVDFAVDLKSLIDQPDIEDLQASLEEAEQTAARIEEVVAPDDEERYRASLRELERVAADVDNISRSEAGEAERIAGKIAAIKADLNPLQRSYTLLAAYQETVAKIERAEQMAAYAGNALDEATAGDLRGEAEKCLRLEDEKGLEAVRKRAATIFWRLYSQTDECWIGFVESLRENRRFASDPLRYDDYVRRAHDCLERGDYEGCRLNGRQALVYLPDEKARENRFYDAGLRR